MTMIHDDAIGRLLARLDGVRETGAGRWLARCPAHEDRSPSLSVRETDDGRVLVHDFGGCDTGAILAAIGLEFGALFPPRTATHHRPPLVSRVAAADALVAIDHEARVVAIIGADFLQHRAIDSPTWQRLALAAQRIGDARAVAAPARIKP